MFMMMMNSTYGVVPGIALITMAFAIAYAGDDRGVFRRPVAGQAQAARTSAGKDSGGLNLRRDRRNRSAGLARRAVFVYGYPMQMPGFETIALRLIGSARRGESAICPRRCPEPHRYRDYGHVFPGHGGGWTWFDSVIFTLIVMYRGRSL